jgi:plastocyanin
VRNFARTLPASLLAVALAASAAAGQSVLERSPNLSGGWVGAPGVLHFNFLHRFDQSGPPQRQVSNAPTFLVAAGLPGRTLIGVNYATSSDVAPRIPNEWEFFGRYLPLSQAAGAPLDAGVQAGYNLAAASWDGEVALGRWIGPVRLMAAARGMSNGYYAGEARVAWAGGVDVRLTRFLALAGDVASLVDRRADERAAWGAGVQLAIPYTPHSLSLHATNTNTATLQGASRGGSQVRYGFEFTIPVTLSRYLRRSQPVAELPPPVADPAPGAPATDSAAAEPTSPARVDATIQDFKFLPERLEVEAGTTITWTNRDQVPHTVTADDGSWDSGLIAPGATWRRTFEEPGTHPFHCTPHPFMRGVVTVR